MGSCLSLNYALQKRGSISTDSTSPYLFEETDLENYPQRLSTIYSSGASEQELQDGYGMD